jgi:hypothetical protein
MQSEWKLVLGEYLATGLDLGLRRRHQQHSYVVRSQMARENPGWGYKRMVQDDEHVAARAGVTHADVLGCRRDAAGRTVAWVLRW